VLRCDKNHPICYQSSLTDAELDQLLSGQCSQVGRRPAPVNRNRPLRSEAAAPSVQNEVKLEKPTFAISHKATRQALSEVADENICPICQDTMEEAQPLTWCRRGCGANLHAQCMLKFSQHKNLKQQETSCPLCREIWDVAALKFDCASGSNNSQKSPPCEFLRCHFCKCNIRQRFYRCLECSQKPGYKNDGSVNPPTDFCADCYPGRVHSRHMDHHFLMSDASIEKIKDVTWMPCNPPFQTHAAAATGLDRRLVEELQNRDLSVNDYDLLLQLDSNPYDIFKISSILIQSLPFLKPDKLQQLLQKQSLHSNQVHASAQNIVNAGSSSSTTSSGPPKLCWCSSNGLHDGDLLCVELLCGHFAHQKCMKEDLDVIIKEDISRLLDYRCAHENCGKIIFKSLQRKKKRPKKTSDDSTKNTSSSSIDHQSSLSINAEGNNVFGNNHHFLSREHHLLPLTGGLRSQTALLVNHQALNIIVGTRLDNNNYNNEDQQMRRHSVQVDNRPPRISDARQTRANIALRERDREQQQNGLNVGGMHMRTQNNAQNNNNSTNHYTNGISELSNSRLLPPSISLQTAGSSVIPYESNNLSQPPSRSSNTSAMSAISSSSSTSAVNKKPSRRAAGGRLLPTIGRRIHQPNDQVILEPTVTNISGGGGIALGTSFDPYQLQQEGGGDYGTAASSNSRLRNNLKTIRRLDTKYANINHQNPQANQSIPTIQGNNQNLDPFSNNMELSVMPLHGNRQTASQSQLNPNFHYANNSGELLGGGTSFPSRPPMIGGTIHRGSVALLKREFAEGERRGLDSLMNINHYES
jgi:hypothetical protein